MNLSSNDWQEIHYWLMDVLERLPAGPFPVLEAVPRHQEEWQEWYSRGLLGLMEQEQSASEALEALLQNPDSPLKVECGRTRYLLRERLRFALASAALLADLKKRAEEQDPYPLTNPDAARVLVSRRRWLLVEAWNLHGRLQWQASILTAALATQALAGWRYRED